MEIPITVRRIEDGSWLAHCAPLRASADGDTPEEAIKNCLDAIEVLIEEFGAGEVFKGLRPNNCVQIVDFSKSVLREFAYT